MNYDLVVYWKKTRQICHVGGLWNSEAEDHRINDPEIAKKMRAMLKPHLSDEAGSAIMEWGTCKEGDIVAHKEGDPEPAPPEDHAPPMFKLTGKRGVIWPVCYP